MATATSPTPASLLDSKINVNPGRWGALVFGLALIAGAIYAGWSLVSDLSQAPVSSALVWVLLGVALAIALGFEFVNGFHDTANAVATVIYTHTLEPHLAVVWSGVWNFIGVLTSTGAVAFGIVSLLPVELIMQVGTDAGFAMVFALLIAAIIWNLATWYFGIPNSSSHTLIGSILGVGVMNQYLAAQHNGVSGVDWGQALNVGKSLLFSPIIGFICSGLLFVLLKVVVPNPKLYREPEGTEPPPFWIRSLLMLTCTGVSFAHGSNDGQKGMGLIMLILVGTVPTAYALNHAVGYNEVQNFIAVSEKIERVLDNYGNTGASVSDPRQTLEQFISTRKIGDNTVAALKTEVENVKNQVRTYKTLAAGPTQQTRNVRN